MPDEILFYDQLPNVQTATILQVGQVNIPLLMHFNFGPATIVMPNLAKLYLYGQILKRKLKTLPDVDDRTII